MNRIYTKVVLTVYDKENLAEFQQKTIKRCGKKKITSACLMKIVLTLANMLYLQQFVNRCYRFWVSYMHTPNFFELPPTLKMIISISQRELCGQGAKSARNCIFFRASFHENTFFERLSGEYTARSGQKKRTHRQRVIVEPQTSKA